MSTDTLYEHTSVSKAVSSFKRVILRSQHYNELFITQGNQESLTIEGPSHILSRIQAGVRDGQLLIELGGSWAERVQDALTTSLSRPTIQYHLEVKQLEDLEIFAMARVNLPQLKADHLSIKFAGAGELRLDMLEARTLDVEMSGVARVELAGQVEQQLLRMHGQGHYIAPTLQSQRTVVRLDGMGEATVWAIQTLEASVRGMGSVSYYGSPKVSQHLTPMGRLIHLGHR